MSHPIHSLDWCVPNPVRRLPRVKATSSIINDRQVYFLFQHAVLWRINSSCDLLVHCLLITTHHTYNCSQSIYKPSQRPFEANNESRSQRNLSPSCTILAPWDRATPVLLQPRMSSLPLHFWLPVLRWCILPSCPAVGVPYFLLSDSLVITFRITPSWFHTLTLLWPEKNSYPPRILLSPYSEEVYQTWPYFKVVVKTKEDSNLLEPFSICSFSLLGEIDAESHTCQMLNVVPHVI